MTVTRADISAINGRLDKMSESLTIIAATCPDCRKMVKEDHDTIQRINTRVTVIEDRQAAHKAVAPNGKFAIWLPASMKPYVAAASVIAVVISSFLAGGFTWSGESQPPQPVAESVENPDAGE